MSMIDNKQKVYWLSSNESYLNLLWKDEKAEKSKSFKIIPGLAVAAVLLSCLFLGIVIIVAGIEFSIYLMEVFPANADVIERFAHIPILGLIFITESLFLSSVFRIEDNMAKKGDNSFYTHVRLTRKIKEALCKELSIHNIEELAVQIHYALTKTPYKDKMTAVLYGFHEVKELEIKDEKQLEEANLQVFSLAVEVLKVANDYKLEIEKAQELEKEQKRKELAEKELREKEEKDFLVSQTLRNLELEFDAL